MMEARPFIPSEDKATVDAVPMVAVRQVAKTYRARSGDVPAVAGVDLNVPAGTVTAIVGPSGCGKSTLLRMMAGLLPVDTGEIVIAGERVAGPNPKVGMMFQQSALLPWRNVLRNVLLPVDVLRLPKAEFEGRARRLLVEVGLAGFERRRPGELSGGMQQRVAICRALVHDPDLLLLDEPFGALDSITREQLNDLLLDVCKTDNKTTVLVTHDIEEAVYLADQVVVMSSRPGRIVERVSLDLSHPRDWKVRSSAEFEHATQQVRQALADYITFTGRTSGSPRPRGPGDT